MIKALLTSRKFWLTFVAVLVPILNKVLKWEISDEQILAVIGSIVALVFGISWEDAATKSANGNGMKSPYKNGETK
jgi:hypothetical protein